MKFSSMMLLSAPLVGMASANYLVKKVPGNKVIPKTGRRSPNPIYGNSGCDNSKCPPPPDMGCYTSTRHSIECGYGNDECWVLPRDCPSLCNCLYSNPINSLLDSCARGTPGTDSFQCWCVFDCPPDGPKNGNGLCTPTDDICKAS